MIEAQLVPFLRHKAYVHNPYSIYVRPYRPIKDWLIAANEYDAHYGYTSLHKKFPSVQMVSMPAMIHNALIDLDCDWRYDVPIPSLITSKLSVKDNRLIWTMDNLRQYSRSTKTPMIKIVDAMTQYLEMFEVNGVNPITPDELETLDNLGVPLLISRAIPLIEDV